MPTKDQLQSPVLDSPDPAFTQSVRLSISQITNVLLEVLGRALVQRLAGISDPQAVRDWIEGKRQPRAATEMRLRTAYRAFQIINAADTEHAARAWFIGLNPQLGDEAPVTAIQKDHLRDVLVAAEAFARTS
jgi:hypothetical protein